MGIASDMSDYLLSVSRATTRESGYQSPRRYSSWARYVRSNLIKSYIMSTGSMFAPDMELADRLSGLFRGCGGRLGAGEKRRGTGRRRQSLSPARSSGAVIHRRSDSCRASTPGPARLSGQSSRWRSPRHASPSAGSHSASGVSQGRSPSPSQGRPSLRLITAPRLVSGPLGQCSAEQMPGRTVRIPPSGGRTRRSGPTTLQYRLAVGWTEVGTVTRGVAREARQAVSCKWPGPSPEAYRVAGGFTTIPSRTTGRGAVR